MRQVKTISVSLEPEYVEQLEALGKKVGSKSDAIRLLLREHRDREMEDVYREYYSDPENVRKDRELTEAMLSLASFPEDWYRKEPQRAGKSRPKR